MMQQSQMASTIQKQAAQEKGSPASVTGVWAGIAAITMTFAAFTSAMVVRQCTSNDWHHLVLPNILCCDTLALIGSSFILQMARRRFAALTAGLGHDARPALRALYGTLALGVIFVVGQSMAWIQLRSEGIYLSTSPSSAFLYVFTVFHALYVIAGLAGLVHVVRKLQRSALRRNSLDAASYYWHFMDALWLYLLFVLWMKL
jgi:cytochrome c oxidase subunit 3